MDYRKVATVYDTYVKTEFDVPFFIKEAQECESVLELTCGTGRLSIPLIEAKVRLTCLDSSGEMLSVLRRKLAANGYTGCRNRRPTDAPANQKLRRENPF